MDMPESVNIGPVKKDVENQTATFSSYALNLCCLVRLTIESVPRWVDKKSGVWRRKGSGVLKEEKEKLFFSTLFCVSQYNNVSCSRIWFSLTEQLNNLVILKYLLWEWVW